MIKALRRTTDILSLLPQGGPSACNIAITNLCDATCNFCSFAHDKGNWRSIKSLLEGTRALSKMMRTS